MRTAAKGIYIFSCGNFISCSCLPIALIQHRCSEIRSQFLDEQAVLNRKYTEVKTTLDTTLMKYDASHAELMRLQKISGINEENLRLEITALTDRCLRLTNLHESESALRRRYEERANKYDVAETELTKLRKEV